MYARFVEVEVLMTLNCDSMQIFYDLFERGSIQQPKPADTDDAKKNVHGQFHLLTNTRCTKLHITNQDAREHIHIGLA